MSISKKNILIINGSIRGEDGNSWGLKNIAEKVLVEDLKANCISLTLTNLLGTVKEVYDLLVSSDAFLIITGVYWNNWSSCLQRFIEVATAFENSPAFFGKPVACAVSMDSVGGIEVAGRIHSVFSGLGCWSPPCSTLVISRIGQEAVLASRGMDDDPNKDVWRLDDIKIVLKNLVNATQFDKKSWISWPHVELKIPTEKWPESGSLNMNTPRFL